MDFEKAFNEVVSNLVVRESDWKFVTSGGASLGVSTPWAKVGVNAGGGSLWVKRDADADATRLDFGGIGGSVGLSLVPTPANFSFSLPAMPSAGRIYKLPFAGWTLTKDELQGGFVMIELTGDFGPGGSAAVMFIGGSQALATAAGLTTGGAMQIPALIATSEACVAFGGMTATLIPANVGITMYVGLIY
jgi:hypothetical protein